MAIEINEEYELYKEYKHVLLGNVIQYSNNELIIILLNNACFVYHEETGPSLSFVNQKVSSNTGKRAGQRRDFVCW